jgi:putative sigma-54 modulation protein
MAKPPKSDLQGYNISIIGKHFQITDAIRNYVFEKFARIEHVGVADHIIDLIVTLDAQKLEHTCSILMNLYYFHIKVTANTDNMYAAIDKATDRIIRLVRRYKSKLQSTRALHLSTVDIHVNVIKPLSDDVAAINDEIEAENAREKEDRYNFQPHPVVATETVPLKMLTQDEAVMKLELSGDHFLIFRGEEDQKIKVLYRREDKNYNLIQLQA